MESRTPAATGVIVHCRHFRTPPIKRTILLAGLLATLAGCSDHAPVVLDPDERARYVYEIIEPRAACEPLRLKLKGKFDSRAQVDALYEEAKKTGCLRREV